MLFAAADFHPALKGAEEVGRAEMMLCLCVGRSELFDAPITANHFIEVTFRGC